MNKILIVSVVLFLLIGGGYFYLQNRTPDQVLMLTVFRDSGEITFMAPGQETFEEISSDEFGVPNGSRVKTNAAGLGHVVLPDDSMISLSVNTEMTISYEEKTTNIFQYLGNAWYRVQKLAGREEFNVETPTTVATVRGTVFGVERGEDEVLYVTESSVEIAKIVDENGTKTKQDSQVLEADKLVTIADSGLGEAVLSDIPEEKKQTPWFRRNQLLNDAFLSRSPREFIREVRDSEEFKQIDEELRLIRESNVSSIEGDGDDLIGNGLTSPDWIGSGEACSYINSSEYQEAVNTIRQYRTAYGAWGVWVEKAVGLIQNACEDNILTPQEAAEIQSFYENQPTPEFTLPQ